MNYLHGRSAGLLIVAILVFLFMGPLIAFVVAAPFVLLEAIRWTREYKKIQGDYDNDLKHQMEILKYKNTKNKQKGETNDNQS